MHLPVAVVAGATGLVGQALVRRLAAAGGWREIRALTRRPLPPGLSGAGVRSVVVDYDALGTSPAWAAGADHIFCALGTTIRQAGSRPAFRHVDVELPRAVATLGLAQGARHFLLVSALGADPASRIFYNRAKGEAERAILELGYRSVTIARPSVLLGPRAERRIGEEIAKIVGVVAPRRWRPVAAEQVAAALIAAAVKDRPGTHRLENADLLAAQ